MSYGRCLHVSTLQYQVLDTEILKSQPQSFRSVARELRQVRGLEAEEESVSLQQDNNGGSGLVLQM